MRSTAKCDIMFPSSGGFISMKTKIIYISGNEVFDMADIRAAFEEVRTTLGLGNDTVMFGVPVDSDDALCSNEAHTTVTTQLEAVSVQPESSIVEAPKETKKSIKKSASTRKNKSVAKEESALPETIESSEKITEPTTEEKIIPILSILAAQKDNSAEETNSESEITEIQEIDKEHISAINITPEIEEEVEENDIHPSEIADMITEDAPEAPIEKTLEQLLESMTPLREDVIEEPIEEENTSAENLTFEKEDFSESIEEDADATLEQLAAEFAENQDKIPTQPKSENHSKIGKLKNILPFKKAKRDETGLMGDLFGWAGIAANDDDFTIPGFFTNAASKK